MDNDTYQQAIDGLAPAARLVFDAMTSLRSATDDQLGAAIGRSRSQVSPRRIQLARMGLVREAGHAPSDPGVKSQVIWELVPPEEVEQVKEQAQEKGMRRLSVKRWPFDEKVAVVQALLREPPVYEALINPEIENGGRRARARARHAMEKAQRERTTEIKLKEKDDAEVGYVLKTKDHLRRAIDVVRTLGFILEDEQDRDDERQPMIVPEAVWPQVTELLSELLGATEQTIDRAFQRVGMEPQPSFVVNEADPELASRPAKPVGRLGPSEADDVAATTDG
jgi:hypothetical protein